MTEEPIAEVRIDREGRLCVTPRSAEFPLIYREAMEVAWDDATRSLCEARSASRRWRKRAAISMSGCVRCRQR